LDLFQFGRSDMIPRVTTQAMDLLINNGKDDIAVFPSR
jgi:hypothetical protein